MFKNFLKVAVRNIVRHRTHSIINVVGLAVGLACCLLIALYVRFELSYDRFHHGSGDIYRVVTDFELGGQINTWACSPEPLGPTIREIIPHLGEVARIQTLRGAVVQIEEKNLYESRFITADPQILNVLTIPFLEGDAVGALDRPGTMVITKKTADKYFSDTSPMEETLRINGRDYSVTGVIADPPRNSHLRYSGIVSYRSFEPNDNMNSWGRMSTYTYIRTHPSVPPGQIAEEINRVAGPIAATDLGGGGSRKIEFSIQPLGDIHLYSHRWSELSPPGSLAYIIIFSSIGILILSIAMANFVNLSTARSAERCSGMGLRRIVGASRGQLILQFLSEAATLVSLAAVAAILIAELLHPLVRDFIGYNISIAELTAPWLLAGLLAFGIIVSMVAGIYPAVVYSSVKPAAMLKGIMSTGPKGVFMRRVLVIGQFAASVLLVIATVTVYRQLDYMRNRPLGFDKEQKLVLPIPKHISIAENFELLKNEFKSNPAIVGATATSSVPGQPQYIHVFNNPEAGGDGDRELYHMHADCDFISEYDISLVAGSGFTSGMGYRDSDEIIINESAVKTLGWDSNHDAVGKVLLGPSENQVTIVGVARDFHLFGLQRPIGPLAIEHAPSRFQNITLTLDAEGIHETIRFVNIEYNEFFPNTPFKYYFLNEVFDRQYRSEEKTGALIGGFSMLGTIIACLGLLGLASYSTQRRTKEIGIRMVLGSSVSGLVRLLCRESILLIVISNIIVWPIAYFVMSHWLEGFAHRIDLGVANFVLPGLAALIAALSIVGLQAFRSARANPIEALRYE
jgi:putative ABC transport system permease protein